MQRLRNGYVGGGFLRFLRFLRILSLKEFFTAAVATPDQVRLGESLPLPDEASPWCWGYASGHAATVSPHYSPPLQRQRLRKKEVFTLP